MHLLEKFGAADIPGTLDDHDRVWISGQEAENSLVPESLLKAGINQEDVKCETAEVISISISISTETMTFDHDWLLI